MRPTLVLVAVVFGCFAGAFAHTSIEIDSGSQGSEQNIKIHSKNKNGNINDIKIGDHSGSDSSFGNPFGGSADSESININWSGDSDCDSKHSGSKDKSDSKWWDQWTTPDPSASDDSDNTGSGPLPDPTTAAPETTTMSTECTCDYTNSTKDEAGVPGQCSFPYQSAQAHCDKWDFSMCRAVCTAAMTLHWEDCTPENVRQIWCKCPYLGFEGRPFSVPDVPVESSFFYKLRYKACWNQCYHSGFDRPWSWENTAERSSWGSYSHEHTHEHGGRRHRHSHEHGWNDWGWDTGRGSPYKK